ncbi:MAG: DUF4910 domain-containing protein [Ignavibacteriales bacterium]
MNDYETVNLGDEIYNLIKNLFPICRSITGNGVRETLEIIKKHMPITVSEIPTGAQAFDWIIPKEWNIKDAYVKNSKGEKVIDFQKNNLHILNYSIPVNTRIELDKLKEHLYTMEEHPEWIPYVTSYYKERWGFCVSQNHLNKLAEDTYEVVIDSSLENGSLTYGELLIPGETKEEILFSTYICHPSICNDNLTGTGILTFLAKDLMTRKNKYSYRFLFIPETIGAIAWLSKNEHLVSNIKCGLVATCLGDPGGYTYQKTRKGNAFIDKLVKKVLDEEKTEYIIKDFAPYGSDERQFSSPAFNMEMGSLMRTMYACFPEYHTSADNLDFIKADKLEESLEAYKKVVYILENDETYMNLNPKCEPQLGRRGLYNTVGGARKTPKFSEAVFWILNQSDGENSLLDVSIRSGIDFQEIRAAADALLEVGLLAKADR